ncbi:MFS transporter [Snuella sedimenti]|uniref:MFS transporter n=1 Tax=Snuella sedimenti TaxID=2798802 RepID=A0A8J7IFZ9_9FLAO|nr:MFS transporter [Snuella sedimenti]MBJ6368567.1 MFS transporter [Snuella sedimenti]
MHIIQKNPQYYKFCAYGFLKNLRFFDAFLLLFFLENGISYTQIGVLYALREITINISEIPSGILADTYGRKKSLICSFILYIASFLIFYAFSSFYAFLLAIVLYGIADAFRSGTHKGMIMDYLKLQGQSHQKANYYGHTRSWSQKGSALSALIAGGLVLYSGSYRSIFLYSVIPYLLNFINIYTYPSTIDYALNDSNKKENISLLFTFKSFIKTVKQRKVLQIINSAALHTAYLKAIKDYIQPIMVQVALLIPVLMHIEAKKKSGVIIGIIYFFIFLANSYASKSASWISSAISVNIPKITLFLGLVAGTITGLLYYFEYWYLALILFACIYFFENIRKPLLVAEIADHVPQKILTSVISAQSFFSTLTTSIIAIGIGYFADTLGIGIAFILISTALLIFTRLVGLAPSR